MRDRKRIPVNTLERLVVYQRLLRHLREKGVSHVFSYQLARLAHNSSVQVRRDLMLVGCTGSSAKGYEIAELGDQIHRTLARDQVRNVALAGVGDLGRAIISYCRTTNPHLPVVAAFDKDETRVGRVISGCRCRHVREMPRVLREKDVVLGLLAVPGDAAQEVAEQMVAGGIKGIVNFTPVPLRLPADIVVEDMDITMQLEKTAFLCRTTPGRET